MEQILADRDWKELRTLLQSPDGFVWLAEHCLWVRDKSGRRNRLQANRVQRDFEKHRGAENIVLKARQMGVSTWVIGRFLLKTILEPGTTSMLVAHTRESAEAMFGAVARMWENLPTDLRSSVARQGRANVGQMTFPRIDSEFRVASASELNAGRGLTIRNLHCSEVSRWSGNAAEILAGMRAAVVPGGEVVLESTPNGAFGCFYSEWEHAEEAGMVRHFFPWWYEASYVGPPAQTLTDEEANLVCAKGLSSEQIGFRREIARRYGALRLQEFAEDAVTCFRTSGACFFDRDVIDLRTREVPSVVEHRRGRTLQVWLPAVAGRSYIASVDAAGGGSDGDFAAVQIIDQSSGMQCAELQARLAPRDVALAAAELAYEYNRALLVVERNNHGAAVLAFLEHEATVHPGLNIHVGRDSMPGWLTDSASRPRMLSELAVLVSQHSRLFLSARLLAEFRSFVTDEHGRAAAARGTHDDLVMSMAIAQAVRQRLQAAR